MKINGESDDVAEETIALWQQRIAELLRGYSAEIVWNLDVSGILFQNLFLG